MLVIVSHLSYQRGVDSQSIADGIDPHQASFLVVIEIEEVQRATRQFQYIGQGHKLYIEEQYNKELVNAAIRQRLLTSIYVPHYCRYHSS